MRKELASLEFGLSERLSVPASQFDWLLLGTIALGPLAPGQLRRVQAAKRGREPFARGRRNPVLPVVVRSFSHDVGRSRRQQRFEHATSVRSLWRKTTVQSVPVGGPDVDVGCERFDVAVGGVAERTDSHLEYLLRLCATLSL